MNYYLNATQELQRQEKIMKLDVSTRLTSQVTTIICQYMKKVLIKKRKYKKIWGTRSKLIY